MNLKTFEIMEAIATTKRELVSLREQAARLSTFTSNKIIIISVQ